MQIYLTKSFIFTFVLHVTEITCSVDFSRVLVSHLTPTFNDYSKSTVTRLTFKK